MSDRVIPPAVTLAAKRGFIRTTAQAYAATIPTGGISAAAVLTLIQNPDPWAIAATAAAALITPPLAGLASFLSIIGKGVPADYLEGALAASAFDEPGRHAA